MLDILGIAEEPSVKFIAETHGFIRSIFSFSLSAEALSGGVISEVMTNLPARRLDSRKDRGPVTVGGWYSVSPFHHSG
jgi:hypothetical protein